MSVSRNATYNLIGAVLPILLALVTVPLYLKLVGTDRYGVLAIAWLLLGYFGLFDLGLGRATTYSIAALKDATPQERADVFWTAILTNVIMGVAGGLVLYAAAAYFFDAIFKVDPALRPEILASVPYLALAVPIATTTGVLSGALQARDRFLETNMISVLSTSLFQILPIIVALIWGPNLSQLLLAAVAARFVAIAVLWWRCHVLITRGQKHRFVGAQIRDLLGYGGWVTVTGLFGPILVILDRFAIGAVLGAKAVTIYTVPFQLAQRISIFPNALVTAVFPRLPTASPEERAELNEKAIRVLLAAISLPILGAIYVLHPFLDLWVGREIGRQAADVGTLIIFGYWANAFAVVPYSWMQGAGRPDLVTKVLMVQIPPYLLLLYFGMKWFGLIGCAAVFALRCSADFLLMWWAARRKFAPAPLIGLVGIPMLAGVILSSIYSYTDPIWWLSGIVLAIVTGALCWRIAPWELVDKGARYYSGGWSNADPVRMRGRERLQRLQAASIRTRVGNGSRSSLNRRALNIWGPGRCQPDRARRPQDRSRCFPPSVPARRIAPRPVAIPIVARRLFGAKLLAEIAQHTQVIQRMNIARDQQRLGQRLRAPRGIFGHEGRLGKLRIQIIEDRERLGQLVAVDFQRGTKPCGFLARLSVSRCWPSSSETSTRS